MLTLKTKADLERIISEGLTESLTIDYKGSEALNRRNPKAKEDLCKDVSAFANSAGGQIIYGIPEKNQVPQPLDHGSDRRNVTPEWIEEVINSNVSHRIEGLHIEQIPISHDGRHVAFVLTIPQSKARAPHMASDNRYYRRFNFQSVAMEDYEVRDVLRRAATPEPFITFSFNGKMSVERRSQETQIYARLHIHISNRTSEPALYTRIMIFIDGRINIMQPQGLELSTSMNSDMPGVTTLCKAVAVPNYLPIFKEASIIVADPLIIVPIGTIRVPDKFVLGYRLQTPGYCSDEFGALELNERKLSITGFGANTP